MAIPGCMSTGSASYQPGITGVRDLPRANYYASDYGWVYKATVLPILAGLLTNTGQR